MPQGGGSVYAASSVAGSNVLVAIWAGQRIVEQCQHVLSPANQALKGALHGAELANRLLAFARNQPVEPKGLVINDILGDVVAILHRTLGAGITVPPPCLQVAELRSEWASDRRLGTGRDLGHSVN